MNCNFGLCFALANSFGLISLACPARYRLLWIVSLATTSTVAFRHLRHIPVSVDTASTIGLFLIMWNVHVISLLTLHHEDKIRFFSQLLISGKGVKDLWASKHRPSELRWYWYGAYKTLYNSRWIGSHLEVPGIRRARVESIGSLHLGQGSDQSTSRHGYSGAGLNPRRLRFIVTQVRKLLVILAVNKVLSYIVTHPQYQAFEPFRISDVNPAHDAYFHRLDDITARESTIRVVTVVLFLWNAYANLTSFHVALAILFVGLLRLDDPDK